MLSFRSKEISPKMFFRVSVIALAVLTTGLLASCGFRPLYGQKSSATSLTAEQNLAQIEIISISDRIGQQLHNDLLSRLNPKGRPADPLYSLSVSVSESIANLGIKKSAVVTRGNIQVTANYSLLQIRNTGSGTGTNGISALTSGRVISTSSYDISQAQYTALAAEKSARERALKEIADDIRTRLAVYFQQASD